MDSDSDRLVEAAFYGNLETVDRLLRRGVDPNAYNADKRTALTQAAWMGHRKVVERLIAAGADTELQDGEKTTPLVHAARQSRTATVEALLQAGADPQLPEGYGYTPLIEAARAGNSKIVSLLLRYGARVNHAGPGNETALKSAVGSGDRIRQKETVEVLLQHEADVNTADQYGRAPLHGAAGFGYVEVIELLLQKGADVDAQDQDGLTPLLCALQIGHLQAARLLIDRGARLDLVDKRGWSTLSYAVSTFGDRCGELVAHLLDAGLAVEQYDKSGATPVLFAASRGNWQSLGMLLRRGGKPECRSEYGETPIGAAARLGSPQCLELLIEYGADPNVLSSGEKTPLHFAVQAGQNADDCVRILVMAGADTEALDSDGNTPIDLAVRCGRPNLISIMTAAVHTRKRKAVDLTLASAELHNAIRQRDAHRVRSLLRAGYRLPAQELSVAFTSAMENDDVLSVRALLAGGLDANSKGSLGKPLLLDAVSERQISPAVVTELLNAGADPRVKSADDSTILTWICGKADESFYYDRPIFYGDRSHEQMEGIAKRLLEMGVDVTAVNSEGETALWWAARKRRFPMVQLLLDRGADPNAADDKGRTPLMWAASRREQGLEMVELLLKREANPLARDNDDRTPLAWAAAAGDEEILKRLISSAFRRRARCEEWQKLLENALVHAASRGQVKTVRVLLKQGVNPNVQADGGKVALVEAAASGQVDVCKCLLKYHARPDIPDSENQTALCAAAWRGSPEIVTALLEAAADPNQPGRYGLTPLMSGADSSVPEVVDSLLRAGADPNPDMEYGETPLMRCTMSASTKIFPEPVEQCILRLVEYGAQVNAQNSRGETPLLFAVGLTEYNRQSPEKENPSRIAAVKALLKSGADLQHAAANGLKPLQVARRLGFDRIADLLIQAGADEKGFSPK